MGPPWSCSSEWGSPGVLRPFSTRDGVRFVLRVVTFHAIRNRSYNHFLLIRYQWIIRLRNYRSSQCVFKSFHFNGTRSNIGSICYRLNDKKIKSHKDHRRKSEISVHNDGQSVKPFKRTKEIMRNVYLQLRVVVHIINFIIKLTIIKLITKLIKYY
jgi:hypothetical protein